MNNKNVFIKKFVTLIYCICLIGMSNAQVTEPESTLKEQKTDTTLGWKNGATIGLSLTQVSLTNWAAGGQNSISGNGILSTFAHYSQEKMLWENYLDVGYGTIKQGKNASWWKTDDRIELTSKYGRKISSKFYYAGLLSVKTQMAPGYNYPDDSTLISDLLSPGYLVGAIGIDYKPQENLTAFFAPATAKMTYVNNQNLANQGAFGVEPATYDENGNLISEGEKLRSEFGGYLRLHYQKKLMENINLKTKLDLFSNYLDNPQNIDVNWEVLIAMKINEYFSATLSTTLLYDHDIDIAIDSNDDGVTDKSAPKTQFKEVLSVGFSYDF